MILFCETNFCADGLRKEARRNRQEAPQKVAPTPVRHIQVRAVSMEKAKGYRQPSPETV